MCLMRKLKINITRTTSLQLSSLGRVRFNGKGTTPPSETKLPLLWNKGVPLRMENRVLISEKTLCAFCQQTTGL